MKLFKKSILLGWQQQSSVKSNSFSLEMMSKRRSLHFCEKIRWASLELGMLLLLVELVPHTVELETLRQG
jgi:hypothetical protein